MYIIKYIFKIKSHWENGFNITQYFFCFSSFDEIDNKHGHAHIHL